MYSSRSDGVWTSRGVAAFSDDKASDGNLLYRASTENGSPSSAERERGSSPRISLPISLSSASIALCRSGFRFILDDFFFH
jgi:hypothetical protein